MSAPKTLTVWYVYVEEHATWSVKAIEDAQGEYLRYARAPCQTLDALQATVQQRFPNAMLLMRLDHLCEREKHTLQMSRELSVSHNQATVFIRCVCGRVREVPQDTWRALHKGNTTK